MVILQTKICVSESLSNMSKNGLRILACFNFHMTHLSGDVSVTYIILFSKTGVNSTNIKQTDSAFSLHCIMAMQCQFVSIM